MIRATPATPFGWKSSRGNLHRLLARAAQLDLAQAAWAARSPPLRFKITSGLGGGVSQGDEAAGMVG